MLHWAVSSRALIVALAALAALALARLLPSGNGGNSASREGPIPAGDSIAAVVDHPIDGDTIAVRANGREVHVRLLGIDTPETHRPGTPIECGGREAAAAMARLAPQGARVTLKTDPTQDRVDRYGRLLAYVFLADGHLVESEQLRAGWATVYVFHGNPVERIRQFEGEMHRAESAHRGVWSECGGDFHTPAVGG
jgi:micrococcal nuclease